MFKVEIVEYGTHKVERSIDCVSQYQAEKVDAGANINLNHDKYFTRIVETTEAKK